MTWEVKPDKRMNANTMVTRVIITHQCSFSCLWNLFISTLEKVSSQSKQKLQVTGAKKISVVVPYIAAQPVLTDPSRFSSSNSQQETCVLWKTNKNTLTSSRLNMYLIFCDSFLQTLDVGFWQSPFWQLVFLLKQQVFVLEKQISNTPKSDSSASFIQEWSLSYWIFKQRLHLACFTVCFRMSIVHVECTRAATNDYFHSRLICRLFYWSIY